jgi:hypothetical protein
VACRSCNNLTCRYTTDPSRAVRDVFEEKRRHVLTRLLAYRHQWATEVAPIIAPGLHES